MDYFDIEIEDVVSTVPVQTVLNGCYVDGVDSFCDLIPRTATGQIVGIELNAQNLALLTAEGIDVDVDYSIDAADLGPGDIGTFGFRVIGTFALENGFQALPDGADGAFFYDRTGFFGARGGVAGEPRPEWKHTAFVNYGIGGFNANLRWRYIGAVTADDQLLNENRTPDGELFEGDDLDGVGTFRGSEVGDENYFDFTAQYQLTESFRLQAGVRNLFDNDPTIVGDSFAEQANTYPATYDALGRRYFVGLRASF